MLKLVRRWYSDQHFFEHQTSGSTGKPRKIKIGRDKIEISARATMSYIDSNSKIKTSLLCLNPDHIGGAMVVYRSLIFDHDLTLVESASNPLQAGGEHYDLVSMVPMQFKMLSQPEMDQFGTILIGGASIETGTIESKANIYSTFGMTETVSHIALRPINEEIYTTTGDTEVDIDENQLLKIKGSITDHKWLVTNDVVSLVSKYLFRWIGRKDFIINSGGIKANPEAIESQLKDKVSGEIMIASLPDEKLGRKIILLLEGTEQTIDFSILDRYHKPKACYFDQHLIKTSNGKIDRRKTQEYFEKRKCFRQ